MVHPSSIVSPSAKIGIGCHIGPYSIIHENVILGDNSTVGSYCELGVSSAQTKTEVLSIGKNAYIRSHCVFYTSTVIGDNLTTGHRATILENTRIGTSFQLGSQSEIQGDCEIGDHVRFQSNVFVGKKTKIGNFVWIFPYVVLTNDPTPPSNVLIGSQIGDYASVGAGSSVMPGVSIGIGSVVAAHSCVTKDVLPGKVVAGIPARVVKDASEVILRDGTGRPAYPWTSHFHRGYPENTIKSWNLNNG